MPKRLHKNLSSDRVAHGDFVYRHKTTPVFVGAGGAILTDSDGYKYLDAEAANGTINLGFDYSILENSLATFKKLPSIPSFCETNIRLEVAERICKQMQQITGKKGRVAFELGGAQGIELALKIVKSNTKKSQFAVFEGGYHGRSIYTSQLSASHRYRALMGDWRIPVVRLPYPDFEQLYPGKSLNETRSLALLSIEKLIETEVGGMGVSFGGQDVAALIIEPLLNAGGIVKPDKEFLETIVKKFRDIGAIIIADEIFCGFYRTGKMFGFQHYDFIPDIVIMSKAITNGITPLSCVWARDPYMLPKNFPAGTHSATYINNPLALSIAKTVLDRYQKWTTVVKDVKKLQIELGEIVNAIAKSSRLTISGYAIGATGRILLKENNAGKILDISLSIARDSPINGVHGLILASTGMAPNVVALNPPLTITKDEIKTLRGLLIATFKKADKIIVGKE